MKRLLIGSLFLLALFSSPTREDGNPYLEVMKAWDYNYMYTKGKETWMFRCIGKEDWAFYVNVQTMRELKLKNGRVYKLVAINCEKPI